MSDHTVRPLEAPELRAAADLFRSALHAKDTTDEEWTRAQRAYQPGRTLGAFDHELIGTARSFDAELSVPGGRRVPMAAVTGVGVRPDRTRRGVLTELIRFQFDDFAARGVPVAMLYASEGAIYSRFGYGVATLGKSYTVDRRAARLRPEVPAGGEITLLGVEDTVEQLPGIYAGLEHTRPGMMTRPRFWWQGFEGHLRRRDTPVKTVVHRGPEGVDGFAVYAPNRTGYGPHASGVIDVRALHAVSAAAFAGLWRYLLDVDLMDEVTAELRPVDEPIELLFTDPRHCRVNFTGDEAWLRLIDVPAALAAREYYGPSLVLEVNDPVLPRNSGRYRVSEAGASRTDAPVELRLGVDALAMLYLGTWKASSLAAAGRAEAAAPEALTTADLLFGTRGSSWCGTFF
jgi:predicted acetyltransferase